jgi:hypothetical protein
MKEVNEKDSPKNEIPVLLKAVLVLRLDLPFL